MVKIYSFFFKFRRKQKCLFYFFKLDHLINQRSDPGSSNLITPKIKRDNSHLVDYHPPQITSSNHSASNSDTSDDPDLIVTRL
jgi:hypothetical protein